MRRSTIVVCLAAAVALLLGTLWLVKRTVRWNDARTMPPPLEAAVRAFSKGDDARAFDEIAKLLEKYRAPAWDSRARVLAATHLVRAGRERDVPAMLPKDLPADDPLGSHASLLRARGLLARGEAAGAASSANRAAAAKGFPDAPEATLVLAAALDAQGRWRDGLAALDPVPTPGAAIAASRIAAAHGDRDGARRRLVLALLRATSADDVDALGAAFEELLPDPGTRFTASERPRLADAARTLVDDGRMQPALDLLALAPASTPAEALVQAEALLKLGRLDAARVAATKARGGDVGARDGARYFEAKIAAAQGRFAAYRGGLSELGRSGSAPWKGRALLDLAKNVEGVPSAATLEAYRRYRAAAGASADPLALLREGWAAFELARNAEAQAGFARALARDDSPDGVRVTALYWQARLADQSGQAARSRDGFRVVAETYRNHYYGNLAAARLKLPAPVAKPDAPPVADPAELGPSGVWLAAGRLLVSVGLWDEASPYYRAAISAGGPHAARVAVEAAEQALAAAAPSEAITFAQLSAGDRDLTRAENVPRALWRLLYPAPYAKAILKAAKESGLDPNLVAAVALQESAYNPMAVSSAGARGLLQVMPAVGAELAANLRIRPYSAAALFEPETNLRLGCAHLKEYIRRFGSVPRALAAYNGGPSRVERWAQAATQDDERFVERIPIPETRLYVKRVLAGARMYAVAWPTGLGAE